MILTGPKIEECLREGSIVIDPIGNNLVGPNSVDLRLHAEMKIYQRPRDPQEGTIPDGSPQPPYTGAPDMRHPLDAKKSYPTEEICIPSKGYTLRPGILYLGRTIEVIGSDQYVPMVEGRSSCGRLGLQVHMTAGFCDTGFHGTITLEMTVVHPLVIYPALPIAQVFFLKPEGKIRLYEGRYQGHVEATASKIHEDRKGAGR